MKIRAALRRDFSPFELSLFPELIGVEGIILGAIASYFRGDGLPLIVMWATFILLTNVGYYLGRCPTCQKPAMREYWVRRGNLLRPFLYGFRFMPEHVCSDCGTDLTKRPSLLVDEHGVD